MTIKLNNQVNIKLKCKEAICFKFTEYSYNLDDFTIKPEFEQIFKIAKQTIPQEFGFYHEGKFLGPFKEEDYNINNFKNSGNNTERLLHFYDKIEDKYKLKTSHIKAELGFFLNTFVQQYMHEPIRYFEFKNNFTSRLEYNERHDAWCQFDFYYLFIIQYENSIGIGTIWYD